MVDVLGRRYGLWMGSTSNDFVSTSDRGLIDLTGTGMMRESCLYMSIHCSKTTLCGFWNGIKLPGFTGEQSIQLAA